jgi:hypothetical protein
MHSIKYEVKFDTTEELSATQLQVITNVVERKILETLDSFTKVDYNSIILFVELWRRRETS